MLPYVIVPPLSVGPFTVHPFGILVAVGITVGWRLAVTRGKKLGLPESGIESLLSWVLISGFIGAHLVENVFYHPQELAERPWRILQLWQGLSSFGGFAGAVFGAFAWKHFTLKPRLTTGFFQGWKLPVRRRRPEKLLPYVDLILSVFPVAWVFGRTGCSIAHDHPGAWAPNGGWLTVAYGRGPITDYGLFQLRHGQMPRYDLGLLELFVTLMIAGAFALSWQRIGLKGYYIAAISLIYAPVRFLLDFLRAPAVDGGDVRYAMLTPGQWACLVLFTFGVWFTLRLTVGAVSPNAPPRPQGSLPS